MYHCPIIREVGDGESENSNAKYVGNIQQQNTACQKEQPLPHWAWIGDNKAGVKS